MSIEKINQGDQLSQSADLVNDNIDKLKMLFPEIVTEGKIDFKVLQQVLGEELEEEEEYYRFTWAGKTKSRIGAHKPSTATLRPSKEDSLNWDKSNNLYIEGDNFEVLKCLQKSYFSKVKLIYVDPPYNTGTDILYKNDYSDNLSNYLKLTNQTNSEGEILFTNSDSSGRYHSEWLSMMYERLILSRNLLRNDGIFCIAIDHHEVHNLIKICDEIFGEENKLGVVAIVHKPEGRNQSKFFGESHEYMIVYARSKPNCSFKKVVLDDEKASLFNLNDSQGKFKKKNFIRLSDGKYSLRENKPDFYYPIFVSNDLGKLSTERFENSFEVFPITEKGQERTWKTTVATAKERINSGDLYAIKENNFVTVYEKLREDQVIVTHWLNKKYHGYHYGTKVVDNLLNCKTFDFPKSLPLIKDIIKLMTDGDDVILDFFSGSGTVGHAVYELNKEENTNRTWIQVQLPEPTKENSEAFKNGYYKITEIAKERLRRSSKKITESKELFDLDKDFGFKVFKLDSSNIKSWDGNPENLKESLFDAVGNIKTDRTEEDVLYEILLKYGLDLTLPIEERIIEGKKVFNVGLGSLFICLADDITAKVAEGIGQWKEACSPEICRVIFKDNGFTDVEKTNSVQTLKRFGINEIRSI